MRIQKILVYCGLMVLSLSAFYACTKNTDSGDQHTDLDRKPMLTHYADHYVIPAYAQLQESVDELKQTIADFTADPTITHLQAARLAWRSAYLSWQKADMLEFGPAEELSLRSYMNTYPATESKIEQYISSGTYNLETFGSKDAQGFPAIDYLLNSASDNDILDRYTNSALSASYKTYLQDVITQMSDKTHSVKNSWDSYRNTFIEATSTDAASSLSKMTNALVLYYERFLRSGKIGYPAGAMTGTALPSHVEAYYSPDYSLSLARQALESYIAFYEGQYYDGTSGSNGLKQYLSAIGTKDNDGTLMADVIGNALHTALNGLNGLQTPLKDAVVQDRIAVLQVYDQLQAAVALLKVDMISALGISITYVDNDGD